MMTGTFLGRREPVEALCQYFNVVKTGYAEGPLQSKYDLIIQNPNATTFPTHVLAVAQANAPPSAPPLIVPVDADLYAKGFNVGVSWSPQAPSGATDDSGGAAQDSATKDNTDAHSVHSVCGSPPTRSVPIVRLNVPHAPSFPLLLIFGLGLETEPNALAWRLLPTQVIDEFPAPAAMAQIFARFREDHFERYFIQIQGLWKNILALGLKDPVIVKLVHTAWNVAVEARKFRQQLGIEMQQWT